MLSNVTSPSVTEQGERPMDKVASTENAAGVCVCHIVSEVAGQMAIRGMIKKKPAEKCYKIHNFYSIVTKFGTYKL